jgi:S1-C subfamily serine protease
MALMVVATLARGQSSSGIPAGEQISSMTAVTLGDSVISQTPIQFVNSTFYPATALLYSQSDGGDYRMLCTATAIEKTDKGYVFVTAAHCACDDDTEAKTVSPSETFFYLTADESNHKDFMKADLTGCGYRHAGDDFAIFDVETKQTFPVVPLGEDPKTLDPIVNVASPLGLGKQAFIGSVSSSTLNRPVVVEDINWTHAVLLQLFGTDGGSSGSSVVCLDQRKICAIVVGSIDKTTIVAVPVSRLIKLRAALAAGTYTHWKPDAESVVVKAKVK